MAGTRVWRTTFGSMELMTGTTINLTGWFPITSRRALGSRLSPFLHLLSTLGWLCVACCPTLQLWVIEIVPPQDLVSSFLHAVSPADLHCLVVADTGATNHMLLDRLAFISYKLVQNLHVCMGNNSYAPTLGQGTAIISLNSLGVIRVQAGTKKLVLVLFW